MKKILSLLLVVAVLTAFVPCMVSADAVTFEELSALASASNLSLSSSWEKTDSAYAAYSKIIPINAGRTGNYSVYIEGQKQGADTQGVNLTYKGTIPAGTYQVEFWIVPSNIDHIAGSWRLMTFGRYNTATHIKGTTDDNGWTKFTSTAYTLTEDTANLPIIGMRANTGDPRAIVVDDIAIKNVNTGEYLDISDSSFELSAKESETGGPLTFDELKAMADESEYEFSSYWSKHTTGYDSLTKLVPIKYGHSGNYSMYMGGTHSDNAVLSLIYNGTIPSGTYTMEFWVVAGPNTIGSWRFGSFDNFSSGNHTNTGITENGWTKIIKTITLDSDTTAGSLLQIRNDGGLRAVVVDDIKLLDADGNDTGIIIDGDFELSSEALEDNDEPLTFDDLKAMADESTCKASSYWSKMVTAYEAKTKLVPIKYGHSGNYSMYMGGTHGDNTELSLIYNGTIPSGTYTMEFWVVAGPNTIGSWRFGSFGDFSSGNHTNTGITENGWTKIIKTITLDSDTTAGSLLQIRNDGSLRAVVVDDIKLLDADGNDTGIIIDGDFEQSQAQNGENIELLTFGKARTLAGFSDYSDDSVWKCTTVGSNVNVRMVPIEQGHTGEYSMYLGGTGDSGSDVYMEYMGNIPAGTYSLEFWVVTSPGLFEESKFTGLDKKEYSSTNTVEAGWTKVTKKIVFNESVQGAGLFGLKLETDVAGVIIDDIKLLSDDGEDTGYILDGGFESITLDYDVGTAKLYTSKGKKITSLSGAGDYKIAVPVINNRLEQGLEYQQITAVYKGNELVKVYSVSRNIPKGTAAINVITDGITIPDDEEYTIMVYTMDSILTRRLYRVPDCFIGEK